MMHVASTISDHKFTVRNLIFQGVGRDFSHAVIFLCDWSRNRLKVSASPLKFLLKAGYIFSIPSFHFRSFTKKSLLLKVNSQGKNAWS